MQKKKRIRWLLWVVAAGVTAATLLFVVLFKEQSRRIQALQDTEQSLQHQNEELLQEIENLTSSKNGIEEHGMLSVEGTQLVDQQDQPVVLRGISSHGLAWYPEYTNYSALKTLKDYGANAFRIAMYVEEHDGYLEEPKLNQKLMYNAIENALAADLYTIVDWHVLKDENPNHNIEEALEALEEIARHYGDHPGILYEICNEPNGDTTYEDIVHYADKVIPAIRKHAPHAVILVGTPKFCSQLSPVIEDPLDYENIMYTYHYYAGLSDCQFAREEIEKGLNNGIPVFVSEWGLDSDETTQSEKEDTSRFLEDLEKNKISWINWSLSNKDEGYSLIQPDNNNLHSWKRKDLSDSGKFVLDYLARGQS